MIGDPLDIVAFAAEGLVDLVIHSIASGGDGVARKDGKVYFVPRTAPGDRIVARVTQGKRFARGYIEQIETPSSARVDPICRHYVVDNCGGCQLQHLTLEQQQESKRAIVRDAMQRIGKRSIELPVLRAGPSPWRYRHRLSLAMRRADDGRWRAGLHQYDDPSVVFELADCLITDERVLALWKEVLAASELLPDAGELRGTVRLTGDRGAFHLEGAREWTQAAAFSARLESFVGVWWTPDDNVRRRVDFETSGAASASFAQVNPGVAGEMLRLVSERVLAAQPGYVIDAYSGVGDLASALHERGVRVAAVELDEESTEVAAAKLAAPSRAIAARVEDVLDGLLPADLVVLNPPRSGVDAKVTAALEASTATRRLFYVSCDPATLARDVARLPSWQIENVTAFDMFPQTAHVETVVELARKAS